METQIGFTLADPSVSEGITSKSASQSWFALGVAPRHEKAVTRLLEDKGYETLLPLYEKRHQYVNRARSFELPLFPGYTFCRFDPSTRLPILTTPGVLHVVGAGRMPVPVGDDEILSIRRAMEAGIALTPVDYWTEGSKGKIATGPLAGLEGIVVDARRPVRLVLSVSLLQRSLMLEIDADCVDPV
jgi:transcription antitermination factor NusG